MLIQSVRAEIEVSVWEGKEEVTDFDLDGYGNHVKVCLPVRPTVDDSMILDRIREKAEKFAPQFVPVIDAFWRELYLEMLRPR